MKDAHCAEPSEKSIFLFLFFELWLIVFTIYGDTPDMPPTKKKVHSKFDNAVAAKILIWKNISSGPFPK